MEQQKRKAMQMEEEQQGLLKHNLLPDKAVRQ